MLSLKPIGSTSGEVSYYSQLGQAEHHDYYTEDGTRPGVWWGEGAAALGLHRTVMPQVLEQLLRGFSPDGTQSLVQIRSGHQLQRRAGFDLTFSMVKSFSVAWSLASPQRKSELERVAKQALTRTLEVVQDLCGTTRRGKDGQIRERAQTLGAVFFHHTARSVPGAVPDPNLHFHVVLPNLVRREDGTWGALDGRALFQRRMKMALGALFRAELARLLELELGVSTYRPQKEHSQDLVSWFELEGIPPALLEAMSKRRQHIESWLRRQGLSGAKSAERAALRTRQAKDQITSQQLSKAWSALAQEHEIDPQHLEALFQQPHPRVLPADLGKQILGQAVETLVAHQARFTRNELLEQTALAAQCQGIGITEVLRVVSQAQQTEQLVPLQLVRGVPTYTTPAMLQLEQQLLDRARRLHQRRGHLVPIRALQQAVNQNPTLRVDQRRSLEAIVRGGDLVSITGIAGSGKTFMLKIAHQIFRQQGFYVLGTALAAKASQGLENESGIPSRHLHQLLRDLERGTLQLQPRSVLVLDEAGMVGTRMMHALIRYVEARESKLILVGDHRQLQAIDAGAPLRMIGETIGTTEMHTIIRQRQPWAQQVVRDFRAGRAEQGLAELDEHGQLYIAADRESACAQLVKDWRQLVIRLGGSPRETIVFAGTNLQLRELNSRLQHVMREQGQLGEYVVQVNGLEISLGDQVMITKNHRLLNLRNGTRGEVCGVRDHRVWLRTETGWEVQLDTSEFTDLSLAYAISVHKGQGISCENALVLTGDCMTDREFAYVAASRARGQTRFYADALSAGDFTKLANRMQVSRAKEMALEHQLEG